MQNTNMLYGVPNETLKKAIREEMELMGLGDEKIRKALHDYPLVDLLHAVQTIIQKPETEHLVCMQKWLRGELVPSSKVLAREMLADIKGVLNAQTAKPNRGPRTGGAR